MDDPRLQPQDFNTCFELERVEGDRFRTFFPLEDDAPEDETYSLFGGTTLGCGAMAGGLTCPDKPLASIHIYFLRSVSYGQRVEFEVGRTRDGRRVSHRQVDVRAGGKLASRMMLMFAAAAGGHAEIGERLDLSSVSPPEALRPLHEVSVEEGFEPWWVSPIEWRFEGRPWDVEPGASSRHLAWIRPFLPIGQDPLVHTSATCFLSDVLSHWPAARLLGGHFEGMYYTSLDTAIWFHRDDPWKDWRLIESECEIGRNGRGLSRRRLWDRSGRLVASMQQEALIPSDRSPDPAP